MSKKVDLKKVSGGVISRMNVDITSSNYDNAPALNINLGNVNAGSINIEDRSHIVDSVDARTKLFQKTVDKKNTFRVFR